MVSFSGLEGSNSYVQGLALSRLRVKDSYNRGLGLFRLGDSNF